jgi:hypothetical protein
MRPLVAFVKQFLIPGSLTFLIAGLVVGLALLNAGPMAALWGARRLRPCSCCIGCSACQRYRTR